MFPISLTHIAYIFCINFLLATSLIFISLLLLEWLYCCLIHTISLIKPGVVLIPHELSHLHRDLIAQGK